MKILGIESSADETAAAVVEDGNTMLSNVVASSLDLHTAYGGIVPEIAARSHIESIIPVIDQALKNAFEVDSRQQTVGSSESQSTDYGLRSTQFDLWEQVDAIAVTNRPGLIGSLLIGVLTARTLAIIKQKPLYGINHVLAHTYANFITKVPSSLSTVYHLPSTPPRFPALALIISGGHTQLMLYKSHKAYTLLGQTQDDAVGEAFDKVAKILGLPYPGGPAVAKAAGRGNPTAIKLPKAQMAGYDFSFSGLKTAVLRAGQQLAAKDYTFPSTGLPKVLNTAQKADLAASFQQTAIETLADGLVAAEREFKPRTILLAGGVAANLALRTTLKSRLNTPLLYPDIKLCTDNAAMIAAAAYYWQQPASNPYKLAVIPSL